MFQSRSYSLSKKADDSPLEKLTYRNDITDDVHSPLNPFNRQTRPSTLPARYRRPPAIKSASVPRSSVGSSPSSPKLDTKLWSKDEVEDGAIFSATLKKVRYRSSVSPNSSDRDSGLLWETLKIKALKGGTLPRLIQHLTPKDSSVLEDDPGFFVCFLCTFKTFASTEDVLDLLLQRYRTIKHELQAGELELQSANTVFSGTCRVLSVWLDHYPGDFDEPPYYPSLHKIINFVKNDVERQQDKSLCVKTEKLLDKLSVSPFACEDPYAFKFCNCDTPVGCTCDVNSSPTYKNEPIKIYEDTHITSFAASLVAEQLTLVDSELFRRVVPRHCLACFWSKRDQLTGARAPLTIKATVDHFNAIVMAVTTTILDAVGAKTKLKDAQARSKVIATWIEIARDCRNLKNFSSLKAIVSGLQSTSIHRLKKTWPLLSKETQALYDELSMIFSDDLNSKASRDLLMQEGTAKYATIDGRSSRKSIKKRQSWIREGVVQGTVPYLGTFLTDLTMIDTMFPNKLENGYINFNKRRKHCYEGQSNIPTGKGSVNKILENAQSWVAFLRVHFDWIDIFFCEFEVIAQIKLFQEAAKNYHIKKNPEFLTWFQSIKPYSEKESYTRSCELEPDDRATTPQTQRKNATLRKHSSVPDLLHKVKSEVFDSEDGKHNKFASLLTKKVSKPSPNGTPVHTRTAVNSLSPDDRGSFSDEVKEIARIMIDGCHDHVYKSVLITSSDRTHDVITKGLEKYDMKESADDFNLYQIIPNSKELHLPQSTNIFYAVNKSVDLKFRLKKKRKDHQQKR